MKIIVLMKQVANKDAILRINKDGTWIEEGDLSFEVNESDGYALEEALRVREKARRRSRRLFDGTAAREERDQRCAGARRRSRDSCRRRQSRAPFSVRGCQRAGRSNSRRKADLVMTGLQSDDYGYGQTGVILAELLGLPHATIVIEVDASGEQAARQARTRKRLVSVVHDADAGAADDSIRHQSDSLRDAEGHHGGEEERD